MSLFRLPDLRPRTFMIATKGPLAGYMLEPGMMTDAWGAASPLPCHGQLVKSTDYPGLFAMIGFNYGGEEQLAAL